MAYIDRDSLCDYYQERFDFLFKNSIKKSSVGYTIDKEIQTAAIIAKEFLDKAKQAPTADVVELKHGEWEFAGYSLKGEKAYVCSECNFAVANIDEIEMKYCGGCGARMYGGTAE